MPGTRGLDPQRSDLEFEVKNAKSAQQKFSSLKKSDSAKNNSFQNRPLHRSFGVSSLKKLRVGNFSREKKALGIEARIHTLMATGLFI
jgi:hypothetical protein